MQNHAKINKIKQFPKKKHLRDKLHACHVPEILCHRIIFEKWYKKFKTIISNVFKKSAELSNIILQSANYDLSAFCIDIQTWLMQSVVKSNPHVWKKSHMPVSEDWFNIFEETIAEYQAYHHQKLAVHHLIQRFFNPNHSILQPCAH